MTKVDHEDFKNSIKCWICKKAYEEGGVKIKDNDHITGKYWESAHQECNLNLSLSKNIMVVFLLQNCDSHLIFQKFGKDNLKINIPKTIEKYMSFTIKQPKEKDNKSGLPVVFVDSAHF